MSLNYTFHSLTQPRTNVSVTEQSAEHDPTLWDDLSPDLFGFCVTTMSTGVSDPTAKPQLYLTRMQALADCGFYTQGNVAWATKLIGRMIACNLGISTNASDKNVKEFKATVAQHTTSTSTKDKANV